MISPEQEMAALKERVQKLETTINKSNFSVGLVLSLENITNNIKKHRKTLRLESGGGNEYMMAAQVAFNVMESAITEEMIRLEDKN